MAKILTEAFLKAAREDDRAAVRRFLPSITDVNSKDSDGRNALHWICAKGIFGGTVLVSTQVSTQLV
jgi:ankyrin repeat protein